ncbi:MAG TPA: helix-turn-helix transcriptional regulator [Thermoanaerobaculia bacterium]|jgi:methylphosphotriester-DNA--protein-cysteine methyltransferase
MPFLAHIPAPPLSDFVAMLWLHKEESERPHAKERILPTGTAGMVINLWENETRTYDREDTGRIHRTGGATVTGACSEYFVIDTAEQHWVMGVEFKAGGAFPFLGMPTSELRNTQVPLDTLWGAGGRGLRERLLDAPTPAAKFRAFERALLEQMARDSERHPAVRFAVREFLHVPHTRTVTEVTDQIGLSPRRFIQVFSEQVGLTPKLFCRVRRFQQVLRLVLTGGRIDWTEIALSCGYFDQAHCIRDFKDFSGLNPTAYAAHRIEHQNHVPILD